MRQEEEQGPLALRYLCSVGFNVLKAYRGAFSRYISAVEISVHPYYLVGDIGKYASLLLTVLEGMGGWLCPGRRHQGASQSSTSLGPPASSGGTLEWLL